MLIAARDTHLESAATQLTRSAHQLDNHHVDADRLLAAIGRWHERRRVENLLDSAQSTVTALATDHLTRAGLIAQLDAHVWAPPPLGDVAAAARGGARQHDAEEPIDAEAAVGPSVYNPYYNLVPNGASLDVATGDACLSDHLGGGTITGPDGRLYALAYPEFIGTDGNTYHLGPEATAVGGDWTTVHTAVGVATSSEGNPPLSALAGAITLSTPTAMPIHEAGYSALVVRNDGSALLPRRLRPIGYEIGDVPGRVTRTADSILHPEYGYVRVDANREIRRTTDSLGVTTTYPVNRSRATQAAAIEGGMLALEAVLAGLSAHRYDVNRATKAYVVLYEESIDGRLRARFIEHQVWAVGASRPYEVRSAGVYVNDGGLARVGLATAPAFDASEFATVSVSVPEYTP